MRVTRIVTGPDGSKEESTIEGKAEDLQLLQTVFANGYFSKPEPVDPIAVMRQFFEATQIQQQLPPAPSAIALPPAPVEQRTLITPPPSIEPVAPPPMPTPPPIIQQEPRAIAPTRLERSQFRLNPVFGAIAAGLFLGSTILGVRIATMQKAMPLPQTNSTVKPQKKAQPKPIPQAVPSKLPLTDLP